MRALMIALSFVVLGTVSNAMAADRPDPETMHEEFEQVRIMKIRTVGLADKSLACNTASDCAKIPMGSRACGGPTDYVVTSMLDVAAHDAVVEQAQLATTKERELNMKYGAMSICAFEMPPAVDCVANLCAIVK